MEELKLILETISDLGGSAMWLFIVYMVKDLLVYLAGFGVIFFGILKGCQLLANLTFLNQIAVRMGFTFPLWGSEKRDILKVIEKGLANKEV